MRTPGSKNFFTFRRRLRRKRPAVREGTLIAYDPRNSFGRKEEIGRAEELLHLDPTRNNSLFFKHRTLPSVRQQNVAPLPAFSSPCHARLPVRLLFCVCFFQNSPKTIQLKQLRQAKKGKESGRTRQQKPKQNRPALLLISGTRHIYSVCIWIAFGLPGAIATLPGQTRALAPVFLLH